MYHLRKDSFLYAGDTNFDARNSPDLMLFCIHVYVADDIGKTTGI